MVPQILPHLQRRHRSSAPRDLAPSEFLHVSDRRRDHQNSSTHLGPHDQRSRIRRMKWPKSSLEAVSKLGLCERGWGDVVTRQWEVEWQGPMGFQGVAETSWSTPCGPRPPVSSIAELRLVMKPI